MTIKKCIRCQNRKFYKVRRGKLRCKKCGYEFKPKVAGLRNSFLKQIVYWFVLGHSIRVIVEQTNASHYLILKVIHLLRRIMLKDVPGIFSGMVEVDETYLGGQKKNKRKSV